MNTITMDTPAYKQNHRTAGIRVIEPRQKAVRSVRLVKAILEPACPNPRAKVSMNSDRLSVGSEPFLLRRAVASANARSTHAVMMNESEAPSAIAV